MRVRRLATATMVVVTTAVVVMFAAMPATAQESIVKSEELIRLQDIPLSMPVSFDRAYQPEQLDYLAWIATRGLDPTSSSWTPRHRAWALYRANLRYSIEQSLRQRWTSAAGMIRSISQNPDTALARFYADALSAQELDEALAFHRSPAGRAFLAYQRELKRVYYAGLLELERIGLDPEYGGADATLADRRQTWVQSKGILLDAEPANYAFHLKSARALMPWLDAERLVFALLAGAPPGTEAFQLLDRRIAQADRETVARYLGSPAAEKEKNARMAWLETLARSRDLLPLAVHDIRAVTDVVQRWQKIRADPRSLPRSIAELGPATVSVPKEYATTDLREPDAIAGVKACVPNASDGTAAALVERARSAPPNTIQTLSQPGSSLFMARQRTGACIPTTPPGYPIPAVNAFVGTVRVVGMDTAQERAWRTAIAQEIAAFGASDSLVVMRNGNAFEVTYAVNVQAPYALVYSRRFLQKGTYDAKRYRIVQRGEQYSSITVAQRGSGDEVRFEKPLYSTAEEVTREDERRASDAKSLGERLETELAAERRAREAKSAP